MSENKEQPKKETLKKKINFGDESPKTNLVKEETESNPKPVVKKPVTKKIKSKQVTNKESKPEVPVKEPEVIEEEFETSSEESIESVEVSNEDVLIMSGTSIIDVLTEMGKISPLVENFTITVTSEEDPDIEESYNVCRDPNEFIKNLGETLIHPPKFDSPEERKEFMNKIFKKANKLSKNASFFDEIAYQFGFALAYFMFNDRSKSYNKVLDKMGKYSNLLEVRYSASAASVEIIAEMEKERTLQAKANESTKDPV